MTSDHFKSNLTAIWLLFIVLLKGHLIKKKVIKLSLVTSLVEVVLENKTIFKRGQDFFSVIFLLPYYTWENRSTTFGQTRI